MTKTSSKGDVVSDRPEAAGDIRIVSVSTGQNTTVMVPIELDSRGNENGLSFTLNYDPNKLSNPTVALGSGTPTNQTLLDINRTQQSAGKIGVSLSLDVNTTYSAGTKQILIVSFQVAMSATTGMTPVTFNSDVLRSFANDVNGDMVMPPANFVNGNVNILGATAAGVSVNGKVQNNKGRGVANAQITMIDSRGEMRVARSNSFGNFRFADVPSGETYTISVSSKQYKFATRVMNISQNLDNLVFTAEQ